MPGELLRSCGGILKVTGITATVKNAELCMVLGGLLSALFFEKGL